MILTPNMPNDQHNLIGKLNISLQSSVIPAVVMVSQNRQNASPGREDMHLWGREEGFRDVKGTVQILCIKKTQPFSDVATNILRYEDDFEIILRQQCLGHGQIDFG